VSQVRFQYRRFGTGIPQGLVVLRGFPRFYLTSSTGLTTARLNLRYEAIFAETATSSTAPPYWTSPATTAGGRSRR